MKPLLTLLLFVSILVGCGENRVMDQSYKTMTLVDFANSDLYIDYDIEYFNVVTKENLKKGRARKEDYPYRAASYRFYKNIEIKENQFVLKEKDYKKLNMSKRVFKSLMLEIKRNNKFYRDKVDGEQIVLDNEIIENLLNQLITEN